MPHRLKRASIARLIVGMAVLAFPLLATGVAQASIAGAAPASTTSIGPPDIVSATPLSSSQVNVCFNKTIALNATSATGFALAGYRSANQDQSTAANINSTNTNCAIVSFGTTAVGQIDKFTVVEIAPGAVQSNSTGAKTAVFDSVTLTPTAGATDQSKDGTTGVTTAPNLLSISAPSAVQSPPNGNSLTFVFDRNTTVVTPANFFFETSAGDICTGGTATGSGTTSITVTFTGSTSTGFGAPCLAPPPFSTGTDSVTTAIRGGVLVGGVVSTQDPASSNPNESAAVTGQTAASSQKPVLTSAVLNPGNLDQIIFTYDRPVQLGNDVFNAEFSNGRILAATAATQTSPTTVAATFSGSLSPQAEYGVVGWSSYGAVNALGIATPNGQSMPGSLPIGDNAGAFSNGFTTGADVMRVNISGSGTVTVVVDQRLDTLLDTQSGFAGVNSGVAALPAGNLPGTPKGVLGGISLLTNTGQVVSSGPPSGVSLATTGPGTYTFTLTYTPFQVTGATMVAFGPNSLETPLTLSQTQATNLIAPFTNPVAPATAAPFVAADWFNVPQIVSTTGTSAHLKTVKVATKKVKKVKKAHKAHKAHKA